jgi:hypothetical protein
MEEGRAVITTFSEFRKRGSVMLKNIMIPQENSSNSHFDVLRILKTSKFLHEHGGSRGHDHGIFPPTSTSHVHESRPRLLSDHEHESRSCSSEKYF